MKSQSIQVLQASLALIRKGWCADAYAKNSSGKPVGSCSVDATCWSIAGAIDNVVEHDEALFNAVWTDLCGIVGADTKKLIARFSGYNQKKAVNFLERILGIKTTASPATKEVVPTFEILQLLED